MAGINSLPGTGQQIALVASLRWNLFRNSLRTLKGRLEAVSIGFVWLMMSGLIFGGGAAMGIGAYLLVAHHEEAWLAGLLWLVFLYWQFSPMLAASVGVQFDFTNLLRFPLRFGSFFTLSLAYGLFEPGAAGPVFWLLCLSAGIGIARPALFLWALLVAVIFAAMNLFLARAVLTWLDRWLAQRRTREVLGFVFILVILCFQFTGPIIQHYQNRHIRPQTNWIPTVLSLAHFFPPGFAGQALAQGLKGQMLIGIFSIALLAAYALIFFWLLRVRMVAQYRGELISETPAARSVKARSGGRAIHTSWHIPFVSSASGAVFEKEVRYTLRSGPMILNIILPVILLVFFAVSFGQQAKESAFIRQHSDYTFPVAAAYTFLIQMNWVFNSFAYDGTGIQFFFLSPVRFREVLEGKNLFHGAVALVDTLAVWAGVAWLFGPPSLAIVAATFAALLFEMLANLTVGNILSICFPKRMDFGTFRRKQQPGVTLVVGMLTELVLIGITGIVFLATIISDHIAFATPIFLILAAATAAGYIFSLKRMDDMALKHRETLAAELCRAE